MLAKTSCPICKNEDNQSMVIQHLDVLGNRLVHVCRHCYHGWDIEYHVDLEQYYRSLYQGASLPRCNLEFWKISRWLKKRYRGNEIKLLDVGANNGRFLWHLPSSWDLYGIELNQESARVAEQYTSAKIIQSEIEDVNLSDYGPFDVITSFAVIEHLMEPSIIMDKLASSLKPGGLLLVMTGDRTSSLAKKQGSKWHMYHPAGHLHFFSKKSLEVLLSVNNMRIERLYWSTGQMARSKNKVFSVLTQIRNICYDLLPLTNFSFYDHLYVIAVKQ